MKTATLCHELPCDQSVAERPRYFARQLITPDDLNLEQDYFRAKLRWHNRLLHGWGVVCGVRVCLVPKSKENGTQFERWKVRVSPGYILGPYGDEIIIDCMRTFDLRTRGLTGITGEPCVDAIDPWCSEVVQKPDIDTLYVAVKYKQIAARPVRVQPVGCGCDDSDCENSRLVDGYEIGVLTYCPDSHQSPPDNEDLFSGPIPDCPPCPDEPWVVLAEVTLDPDGNVTKIDNCVCRRMVLSLGNFWWQCSEPQPGPSPGPVTVSTIEPQDTLRPGVRTVVRVTGANLDRVKTASFGPTDIEVVGPHNQRPDFFEVDVVIANNASPGKRALILTDAAGAELLRVNEAIEIVAVAAPPGPAPPAEPPHPSGRAPKVVKRKKKPSDDDV